jgi:hypothetical protein
MMPCSAPSTVSWENAPFKSCTGQPHSQFTGETGTHGRNQQCAGTESRPPLTRTHELDHASQHRTEPLNSAFSTASLSASGSSCTGSTGSPRLRRLEPLASAPPLLPPPPPPPPPPTGAGMEPRSKIASVSVPVVARKEHRHRGRHGSGPSALLLGGGCVRGRGGGRKDGRHTGWVCLRFQGGAF